ncbi:hypothetical protein [Hyalangium sp.]|uniref:hypothetical protein n=1 Tax=Hyalangium sp. TaxID=2028555 RepID=UPI002D56E4D0|nr:hypothetical protein [Hyalangium sp.]HYH98534.1 hypothetical protein [Hyalangium sp.]
MSINPLMSGVINNSQNLSSKDMEYLASVPPEQRPQVAMQMQMQKESELVTLITNVMKQLHETRMAVIRNIG